MSLPLPQPRFDAPAYLAWEAGQADKHEYVDGEVFAMAGASDAHVTIAGNLYMALRRHLRGGPCSVFISDMKLQVAEDNAFFYPDVFVTCAEADRAQSHFKSAPTLVAEVLSPSTSAFDRGAKFAAYRKLTDLQEYLIVDIAQRRLELYRRAADHWLMFDSAGSGPALQLQSVDMALSPAEAFEDLDEQT